MRPLELAILPDSFAVSRLDPSAAAPDWAASGELQSVTRTASELSVVCRADAVPPGVKSEPGWRAIRVAGTLEFSATGVLSSLAGPLAQAEISIFALSTHDTDYLLVKADALGRAIAALTAAGHRFPERAP
ncbi:MAG: ACT domain-containing protein [Acidobacteriota bacterium]